MPSKSLNTVSANASEKQHARTLARYLMKSFGREKAIKTCVDNKWALALATIDNGLSDQDGSSLS